MRSDGGEIERQQVLRSVRSEHRQNFFGPLPAGCQKSRSAASAQERSDRQPRRPRSGRRERRGRREGDAPGDRAARLRRGGDAAAPKKSGVSATAAAPRNALAEADDVSGSHRQEQVSRLAGGPRGVRNNLLYQRHRRHGRWPACRAAAAIELAGDARRSASRARGRRRSRRPRRCRAARGRTRRRNRACASRGAAGRGRRGAVRDRPAAPPRASPRSRSGGARSRRRRGRRPAPPWSRSAGRRPRTSRGRRRSSGNGIDSSRPTATAARALATLWRPGIGRRDRCRAATGRPPRPRRSSPPGSGRMSRARRLASGDSPYVTTRRLTPRQARAALRRRPRSRSPRRRTARDSANAVNASTISSRSRYVSRWSASTLVITATTGVSSRKERSYSSASATRYSPVPSRASVPRIRTWPPTTIVGSKPGLGQHEAGHRGRRRLAVRAGDRDALLEPHDLAEHLGAADDRDARRARGGDFGVRLGDRRGDDDAGRPP